MQPPLFRAASSITADTFTLTYLAGLFDGEGYVGFYDISAYLSSGKRRGRPRKGTTVVRSKVQHSYGLRIGIGQSGAPGKRLISYLQENFGGRTFFDASYGSQEQRERRQPAHQWNVSGEKAADLLRAMLPFLRVKRLPALVAIEFVEAKPTDAESFERWRVRLLESRQA